MFVKKAGQLQAGDTIRLSGGQVAEVRTITPVFLQKLVELDTGQTLVLDFQAEVEVLTARELEKRNAARFRDLV